MNDDQVRRYARHILLPDVGGTGQTRLLASACVVPVGPDCAAETCALMYLAAAGVGSIGLAGDLDAEVTRDEQRTQPIYGADDIGRKRGQALIARCTAINPDVAVVTADEVAAGAPTVAVPATPWLAFAPPVAAALARGGAAASQLLPRLYREPEPEPEPEA